MIKPELIPFELRHAYEIDLRDEDKKQIGHWGEDHFRSRLSAIAGNPGAAFYTCMIGNSILFCGGMVLLWPGVGEFWGLASKEVDSHRKSFFHITRCMLNQLSDHYKLHRAQAHVWMDYEKSIAWLERLGFSIEGMRREWSPPPARASYYEMARLF